MRHFNKVKMLQSKANKQNQKKNKNIRLIRNKITNHCNKKIQVKVIKDLQVFRFKIPKDKTSISQKNPIT